MRKAILLVTAVLLGRDARADDSVHLHTDAAAVSGFLAGIQTNESSGVRIHRVFYVGLRLSLGARFDLASGYAIRAAAVSDSFLQATHVDREEKTRSRFMYGLELEVDGRPTSQQVSVGARLAASCACHDDIPGPLITAGARVRAPGIVAGLDLTSLGQVDGISLGVLATAGVSDRRGKYALIGSLVLGAIIGGFVMHDALREH